MEKFITHLQAWGVVTGINMADLAADDKQNLSHTCDKQQRMSPSLILTAIMKASSSNRILRGQVLVCFMSRPCPVYSCWEWHFLCSFHNWRQIMWQIYNSPRVQFMVQHHPRRLHLLGWYVTMDCPLVELYISSSIYISYEITGTRIMEFSMLKIEFLMVF